jgi:hypothetical protein
MASLEQHLSNLVATRNRGIADNVPMARHADPDNGNSTG